MSRYSQNQLDLIRIKTALIYFGLGAYAASLIWVAVLFITTGV